LARVWILVIQKWKTNRQSTASLTILIFCKNNKINRCCACTWISKFSIKIFQKNLCFESLSQTTCLLSIFFRLRIFSKITFPQYPLHIFSREPLSTLLIHKIEYTTSTLTRGLYSHPPPLNSHFFVNSHTSPIILIHKIEYTTSTLTRGLYSHPSQISHFFVNSHRSPINPTYIFFLH
jgi:hypothetical protein